MTDEQKAAKNTEPALVGGMMKEVAVGWVGLKPSVILKDMTSDASMKDLKKVAETLGEWAPKAVEAMVQGTVRWVNVGVPLLL